MFENMQCLRRLLSFDHLSLYPKNIPILNYFHTLGAASLLRLGTLEAKTKYNRIIANHQCGKTFNESSGNMEAACTLQMFQRSEQKYGIRYHKYIGDGDSKTFSVLTKKELYKGAI